MDVATLERLSDADVLVFCDDNVALAHFGILGMHWGDKNGPPYPLGSEDHSKEQMAAAKATGTQLGKSSGKGSIANMSLKEKISNKLLSKKKKSELQEEDDEDDKLNGMKWGNRRNKTANESEEKTEEVKELTPEEKEKKRQEALNSGDINRIKEVADQSTVNELNEAMRRVEAYKKMNDIASGKQTTDSNSGGVDESERKRQEALKSGDPARIKSVAGQSSLSELDEAMKRVDMYAKIDKAMPAQKTALDRVNDAAAMAGKFSEFAEGTIKTYNNIAKVWNKLNPDGDDWPVFENGQTTKKTARQKAREKAVNFGDYKSILESINEYSNSEIGAAAKRLKNTKAIENYMNGKQDNSKDSDDDDD